MTDLFESLTEHHAERLAIISRRDFYVYMHINKSNGEVFYVGKGYGNRAFDTKNGRNRHWKNIVKKYGFSVEFVQFGLQEWYAFELEKELIAALGRRDTRDGYLCNMTDGGEGASGCVRSAETRAKVSLVHKGKTTSEETKAKIGAANRGKVPSAEHRNKISAAMRGENHPMFGKRGDKSPNFGKKLSKEHREKLSISKRGDRHPFFGKTLSEAHRMNMSGYKNHNFGKTGDANHTSKAVVCIETGIRYGSIKEASIITGVYRSGISKAVNLQANSAGGYTWKYAQ